MSFATHYLNKHGVTDQVNKPIPDNLDMIVIIPCYNEPDLPTTLNTLLKTHPPSGHTDVLVIVNDNEYDTQDIKKQNQRTFHYVNTLTPVSKHITVHGLYYNNLPKKLAGAGYARKLGMDQAIYRFNAISNPTGTLLSLDADTQVEPNYLTTIAQAFQSSASPVNGCNIHFEHPLQGHDYDEAVYQSICLYELRLRYYKNALAYTGFPYAFHTVGSCFAVKAETYVKQGGMNKRQGGEDFYFLNKIFPLGGFKEISSTTVHPSPRPSNRVPFGTGPSVQKNMDRTVPLSQYYPLQLFTQLRSVFSTIVQLFGQDRSTILQYIQVLPPEIQHFLKQDDFVEHILEINGNVASEKAFLHRFFQYFNAFNVVKFLNEASRTPTNKGNLIEEARKLLSFLQINTNITHANEMLELFRKMDKKEPVTLPQQ